MDVAYLGEPAWLSQDVMTLTRVIHAPRRRVFEAFTRKRDLERWWGPEGFQLVTCELDVREGGALRFVMRGPDGADYPFHGAYLEVLSPARLIFTADLEVEGEEPLVTSVNFEEVDGSTWLTVRQTVPATEDFARGQRQGWSESLERLQALVAPI